MEPYIKKFILGSSYKLGQFTDEELAYIEENAYIKKDKNGKDVPYITCPLRDKTIKLTKEELFRQLYIYHLHSKYQYPYAKMQAEYSISFGREKRGQISQCSTKRERALHI